MRKDLTEIVFILDRSGSMSGLESDTIGGFNSMLAKQQKQEGEAYISTVLFDNEMQVLHDRVSIRKVKPLTDEDYYVGGCTALLDAVGRSVKHIAHVHKYAREDDRPAKTMVVIITDGFENASREYSYRDVKKLITHEQEKYGWEFIFMGANIDAVAEADRFGIREERAVRYENDCEGVALNFDAVECCMESVRACAPIPKGWSAKISANYKSKNKK